MIRSVLLALVFWVSSTPLLIASAEAKTRVVFHQGYSEENTRVPVTEGKPATYVIRRVVDCKNAKGDCEPLTATSRYRLEDSSGFGKKVYYDPDPALNPVLPIGWVVNSKLYLTKRTGPDGQGERVVMVRLPEGKVIDQETYQNWVIMNIWSLPGSKAILLGAIQGARVPVSVLEADGRITDLSESDWNRRREARAEIPDCPAAALDAAIPPESVLSFLPGRPYTELHRRAAGTDALIEPELDPAGSGDEVCAHYVKHFWVGKRRDGQGWNAVGFQGALLSEGKVFGSMAEAENAGLAAVNGRENARAQALVQAAAQAEAIRLRDLEYAERREQVLAELRPKAQALWEAGAYKEATELAAQLTPDEYASYIWYSPVSERADYAKGIERLRAYGRNVNNDDWSRWLQYRHDAMLACEAERTPPPSARSRWESLSPYDQSMLILKGPPGGHVAGPDERVVFDATAFEWKVMSGAGGAGGRTYDVINVPNTGALTPEQISAREQAYSSCMAKVRSE